MLRSTKSILKRAVGQAFPPTFYSRLAAHSALQRQFKSVFSIPRVEKREIVWDKLLEHVGTDAEILYLEFGVWQGYSIKYFSERFKNQKSRFIGCDSFIGLPEAWGESQAGRFTTEGNIPQIEDTRVEFIKGWFQNTFNQLSDIIAKRSSDSKVVIHFDADIYSATLFILSNIHDLLDNYYCIFDEFPGEESLALLNYIQAYGANVEFFDAHFRAGMPRQVSGYLTTHRGNYSPG